ncbi:MAG: hypothetical protein AB7O24_20325 [Kofleriaceae bacterium]
MRARKLAVLAVVAACGGEGAGDDPDGPTFAEDHPRIYIAQNRDRLAAQLAATAPPAMRFKSIVDRWTDGQDVYGFSAWNAALVGQLTGDPKYCSAAIAAVDEQVTAAEAAAAGGDSPEVARDSYLEVGGMIGDVALVYDWCFDQISEDRRAAWLSYADQAVWNVWNHNDAAWGGTEHSWSGWATDDPSNNYHYSFLRATMLLGLAAHDEIPRANEWLTAFHDEHIMGELIPTFEAELVGGGSLEGTGYGISQRGLFQLYDFWAASTEEVLATKTGHTRASMLAMMHSVVPTLDRIAPTGDHARDSSAAFFDYHRAYLQTLVSLFPDDPVSPRAQAMLEASSVPRMQNQFMYVSDFLYANEAVAPTGLDGLGTAYYAEGIGQLYARSSWESDATWLNLIAGRYSQSHAHQDQGSLMIYKGEWLAYDSNIDSSSGLRQEVDAHGLVRIVDGGETVRQRTGTQSKLVALHRGAGWLHAAADLKPAYKGNAAVQKLEREIVFIEPDIVVVYDRVVTKAGGEQIWQLVSPAAPEITGTRATLAGGAHTLYVDRILPAAATSTSFNLAESDSDFRGGFRLDTMMPGGDQRYLHVLSIDTAVTSVTAETNGVTIALSAGGSATVTFNPDAVGGSLTLGGTTHTLSASVDKLAE